LISLLLAVLIIAALAVGLNKKLNGTPKDASENSAALSGEETINSVDSSNAGSVRQNATGRINDSNQQLKDEQKQAEDLINGQ